MQIYRGWVVVLTLAVLFSAAGTATAGPEEKLGPVLRRWLQTAEEAGDQEAVAEARRDRFRIRDRHGPDLVPVILEPQSGYRPSDVDPDRLAALGAIVDAESKSYIRVLVPPRLLRRLAEHPDVAALRAPAIAQEVGLGPIVSEAAALVDADRLNAIGVDGTGIKVAVVDLGFIGLNAAISAGELPANTIVGLLPGQGSNPNFVESGTPHGTAVAEEVMDIAPGVELHVIVVDDQVDLENMADYLVDHQIDVANHSVAWVGESYYDGTGSVSEVFNQSVADGTFWAVAAGNYAKKHWNGTWSDADSDLKLEFKDGLEQMAIEGVSGDSNTVVLWNICIFVNWDEYPGASTDLDLYIVTGSGSTVKSSRTRQTGSAAPLEWVCFDNLDTSRQPPYFVEVRQYSLGPTPDPDLPITVFSFNQNISPRTSASSLMDPSSSPMVFSVAAIEDIHWEDEEPPIRSYSSRGPTTNGNMKPDITGPDGTKTYSWGGNSSGTSFSSPVVAGAAALALQLSPWLAPHNLGSQLQSHAFDIGDPGDDYTFGAGQLELAGLLPICADGVDNDGDGFTDDPDDPGCETSFSEQEDPACNDGLDNDGDDFTDLDDPQCGQSYYFQESSACGIGAELALLMPPLIWLYRRRRARAIHPPA